MTKANRKALFSAILSIILCLSLISGATLALFTDEAKVNIAVTSGKVDVTAEIIDGSLKLWSAMPDDDGDLVDEYGKTYSYVERLDGKFANGGDASFDKNDLNLNLITPGDKVAFQIAVANNSNIAVQYRVRIDCTYGADLFYGLVMSVDGKDFTKSVSYTSDWFALMPEQAIGSVANTTDATVDVTLLLPIDATNRYQDKTCKITYTVEAVQGNASVDNEGNGHTFLSTNWSVLAAGTAVPAIDKDNVITITNAHELAALANSVNAGNTYAGVTVKLANNIDLAGAYWTPIGIEGSKGFAGTFDGNEFTVSGLTVDATAATFARAATAPANMVGLFGLLSMGTVKNLTVENAKVSGAESVGIVAGQIHPNGTIENVDVVNSEANGNHWVGGIAGFAYGSILNCSATNVTLTAIPDDNDGDGKYDNGDKVGGIVGYFGEGSYKLENNAVKNVKINAYRDAGGIAGLVQNIANTKGNQAKDVEIFIDQATFFYAEKPANAGAIVGSYSGTLDPSNLADNFVATGAAMVNGELAGNFDAAMDSALNQEKSTIELNHDIEWVTGGGHGSTPMVPGDNSVVEEIVFDGKGTATLTATGAGVGEIRAANGGTLVFKNMTIKDETKSYAEGSWEFTYLEFAGNLKFENVTFLGGISVDGESAEFVNCTFVTEESSVYAVWVSNGTATFTGCDFKGTRGLKMHEAYGSEIAEVVVDGCTFGPLSEKPGIAIGTLNAATTVKVLNSNFNGCQAGDAAADSKKGIPYVYETDTNVANFTFVYSNNTVASVAEVTDAESLKDVLVQAGNAGAGNTVITFTGEDIDLTGETWTPIKVDGYHGADIVTLDGNGATITGLTAPLFAGGFAGGSGIVIKNLTIADSNIVSTNTIGSGAFIESVDSMDVITLENCHLLNSTVTGGDGSRTGGLIGWTAGYSNVNDGPVKTYVTIRNCSVIGNTITCNGSVGGIYGHAGNNDWTYSLIENCTVQNNKLISTDDGGWRVGVVVGTANVGEVTINNITASGNTLEQTGKTAPAGQSDLYGRFVPGTTGKLWIDGKEI